MEFQRLELKLFMFFFVSNLKRQSDAIINANYMRKETHTHLKNGFVDIHQ